ncbi:MAG: PHB depolymerase family esterase [Myxococcota bacterium]
MGWLWLFGPWLGCSTFFGAADGGSEGAPAVTAPSPSPSPSPSPKKHRRARSDDEDIDVIGAFSPAEDPCAASEHPGLYTFDQTVDGQASHALLFVPPGPGPHDLVVILHGGTSTPERILSQTRFVDRATADGFAVLAPSAAVMGDKGAHWNSGKFDGKVHGGRDDVAFLDDITASAKAAVCGKRVLSAGFSSGGQMAHRWGCEGKEPDAVLSAAGELLVDPAGCTPRPVRGYVGTQDKVFDGPPLEGSDQPSAVQTIELWAKLNGCSDAPPVIETSEDAACRKYQGCAHATELCVVDGFPHGWPSPTSRRKPTRCDATADGMRWFEGAVKAPAPAPAAPAKGGKKRGRG